MTLYNLDRMLPPERDEPFPTTIQEDEAMPVAKKTAAQKGRKIDWVQYGARSSDAGEEVTFRPKEVGDSVDGVLAEVKEVHTKFGEKTVISLSGVDHVVNSGDTVEVGTGQLVTIWPTPGLLDELGKSEADEGDTISIELVELVDTGKGNPFKSFSVKVVN